MSGRTRTTVLTFAGILAFVVAGCSAGDNDAAISGSASGADQGPILVTFGPVDGKSGPQAAYNGVLRVDGNCVYVEDPDGTETGLRFPDGTRLSPDHTTVIF